MNQDNLDSAPKAMPLETPGEQAGGERYGSIDEMRTEFGSYRVNASVENLCDSAKDYSPIDPVPFGALAGQSPINEQSETPEGY